MAAAATISMQLAALLLCLVVLAASPRVALGNCLDDCVAGCNGWLCQLSCASACYGEVGIATLSTSAVAESSSATAEAPAAAPQAQEEGSGGVSVLRGLKPSPARG